MVDLRQANCLWVVQSESLSRFDAAVLLSLMVQVFAIKVQCSCLTTVVVQDWWSHRELRVALIVLVGLVRSLSLLSGTSPSSPTGSTTLSLQRCRTEIWRVLAARADLLLLLDHYYLCLFSTDQNLI